MTLGLIDLLLASVPMIGTILGVWFKMNNLVIRQDMKIINLEMELREIKRHNEIKENKMDNKLDELLEKITGLQLHFMACSNYKPKS